MRASAEADATPSELAAVYYAQGAAAGLVISEATAVSKAANGAYLNTPGMSPTAISGGGRHRRRGARGRRADIAGTVHEAGGRMFIQLWHVGRMGHPDISGVETVARSAIAADMAAHTPTGKSPLPVPRALRIDEIGAGRVGLRISPGNGAGDMRPRTRRAIQAKVDEVEAYEALLNRIAQLGLAYPHLLIEPAQPAFAVVRSLWEGTLVLNTPREIETNFCELENLVEWGVIGAAAVGRAFLANPDLVDRLTQGAEPNEPDAAAFYSSGPVGCVYYPTLAPRPMRSRSLDASQGVTNLPTNRLGGLLG